MMLADLCAIIVLESCATCYPEGLAICGSVASKAREHKVLPSGSGLWEEPRCGADGFAVRSVGNLGRCLTLSMNR